MTILNRIQTIEQIISAAEEKYGRTPNSVRLLAVSKGQDIHAIQQAFAAGLCDFGESYLQEARTKITSLQNLNIAWHFIGPIQSNKTKEIARYFHWVHSVSRIDIATRLNNAHSPSLPPLQICIQINFGDDDHKSGISPTGVDTLVDHIQSLPHLKLRGLMLIPKYTSDHESQYASFLRLYTLLHRLNQDHNLTLDTLSMGMSEDYLAAIRAGSTIVRLGRSIFEDTQTLENE